MWDRMLLNRGGGNMPLPPLSVEQNHTLSIQEHRESSLSLLPLLTGFQFSIPSIIKPL